MIKSNSAKLSLVVAGLCCMAAQSIPNTFNMTTACAEPLPDAKPFVVFDGTLYAEKPDLAAFGVLPITIVYAGKFGPMWHKQSDRLPEKEKVQQVAHDVRHRTNPVVIDIEHWPLKGETSRVQNSLEKYMTVLQWFKEAAPGLAVGFYGAPPLRDYWRSIRPPASKEWQSFSGDNDRLRPLAEAVDVLFPSLYTFYTDQGGWVRFAHGQIEEARRHGSGKPVFVFLWPQYHDSNRALAGTYLPADYWRLELETARQYADGVVLWGGWGSDNRPMKWDDDAAWWKVTKEFMKTIGTASQPHIP